MTKIFIAAIHITTQSSDHYTKCIEGTLDEVVSSIMNYVESDQDGIDIDFLKISKTDRTKFYNKLQEELDKQEEV